MPQQYLLHVHSHPVRVPLTTWTQWYTEEHLRDMVYFRAARTAAFYRATSSVLRSVGLVEEDTAALTLARIPSATSPDGNDFKDFLALYQTDRKHCLESAEYRENVRLGSELWDAISSSHDVGSFAPTDLELVEVLGSYSENEEVAAHIIHCKITGSNVESWLRHEHVNAASQLDGYRRSLLYRPVPASTSPHEVNGTATELPSMAEPYVILLHEFEAAGHGKGLEKVKEAMEAIEGSKGFSFSLRAFGLVSSEGFGGNVRTPERLPVVAS